MCPVTVTPRKTVELSTGQADYYDAAANTPHRDFGSYRVASEDFYFDSRTRQVALQRLRREVRNNPYLSGIYAKYPEAIGHAELRITTPSRGYNDVANLWWYRYAKRVTTCGLSLRALQYLRDQEHLVAGEIFAVALQSGRIALVPSEYCGSPLDAGQRLPYEENGIIRHSAAGAVRAYRFGRMNEHGMIDYSDSMVIPARYVWHDYCRDRVLQGRGLPILLPSLAPARDLYEITRAKTKQIKDASKFTGWIESANAQTAIEDLGGKPLSQHDDLAIGEDENSAADRRAATKGEPMVVKLTDGTFVALDPGEKLNLLQTQYHAEDARELVLLMLHAVSAPVGMPVELWFSGLGKVNYSGFKGLGTVWDSRRDKIAADREERFLEPIRFWRMAKATKEGELPPHPTGDLDLVTWRQRRKPVLDEDKHAGAVEKRLRAGVDTVMDIWEEQGKFAEEVLEIRREQWIRLQIAAGRLDPAGDHSAVQVPIEWLLRGRLPGEQISGGSQIAPDEGEEPAPETEENSGNSNAGSE